MTSLQLRAALAAALLTFGSTATHAQSFFSAFTPRNTGQEEDRGTVRQAASTFAGQHEAWAQPYMQALFADGEWGAVLNFQRLGLAAMEKQRFALAARSFDEAIRRVEEIYANDANAEKARSVFNAETVKDFKGEPYERAMLYYYRGVLYAHDGDYQNARASFLAADRHVTLSSAESAAFKSDFGLLKYLAGWASYCDNDGVRGEQLVTEARGIDSKIGALPMPPTASVVLVDAGPAPVKWGDGEYKHILKFKAGNAPEMAPALRTGGKDITGLPVAGDLVYQASTRGGREVDGIMAGKASFKDTAGQIGNAAMTVGTHAAMLGGMSGNRDMAGLGLAGMFVGLIAKSAEAAANPAADTRSWDSLPARIHVHADADGARGTPSLVVNGKAQPLPLAAAQGKCAIAWGRAVPPAMNPTEADASFNPETNRGSRNKALRESLVREFVASN